VLGEAAAVQWAMDAFGHLKAIGASDAAKPLLDKAGVVADEGIVGLGQPLMNAAAKRFYAREPGIRTLA
jgi:catalase